jgi:hypothetical protein
LYAQRIDWKSYDNPRQLFTSEREFILGAFLSNTPETVLKLQTFQDIFKIKDKGNHFKTKMQKVAFIQKCGEALKKLPYNTLELLKLKKYIDDEAQILGVQVQKTVPLHFITATLEV